MSDCVNVAIFASNSGLNTENIIKYFEYYLDVKVSCVITNNKDAEFINNIRRYKVPVYVENGYKNIDTILTQYNVHYIVLDEYMDKIPPNFCNKYMWKIINIHQSILPKYGGKGMYGNNIHKLVKNNNDSITGISIHFVNSEYHNGNIIFQKEINIGSEDTVETIKSQVERLELKYYPTVIEKLIKETYKYLYE